MATPADTRTEPIHELAPEELGAWRGLLRVHSALVKALDAELLAAHSLPLTSYEVLINLQAAPGRRRRMAELADGVLLSRSGMTRLVDRLERDGLLGARHLHRRRARHLRRAHRQGRGAAPRRAADAFRRRARALPAALRAGRAAPLAGSGTAWSRAPRILVQRLRNLILPTETYCSRVGVGQCAVAGSRGSRAFRRSRPPAGRSCDETLASRGRPQTSRRIGVRAMSATDAHARVRHARFPHSAAVRRRRDRDREARLSSAPPCLPRVDPRPRLARPHRHAEARPRRGPHPGLRPARHQGRRQDARGPRGRRPRASTWCSGTRSTCSSRRATS